jgi:hypothetical protein
MSLQGYYNRFSASDKYDELLFRASKGLQSAELNESQSILSDRITKIANSLFQDGAIINGGAATVDPATGAVTLLAVLFMCWVQCAKSHRLNSTFRQPAVCS